MRCPACQEHNPAQSTRCQSCGVRFRRRPRRPEPEEFEDESGVSSIIPYKNVKALIAYYAGIFGLIPGLGLILGPLAFFLGIGGLMQVHAHPKAKGTAHAIVGVILGPIGTLISIAVTVLFFLGWFKK